ncbi:MAG TPA: response regulator [Cyclobacteriaceae bacterium]|nr:response regulator [Cyclobacteriaceae bacterium]
MKNEFTNIVDNPAEDKENYILTVRRRLPHINKFPVHRAIAWVEQIHRKTAKIIPPSFPVSAPPFLWKIPRQFNRADDQSRAHKTKKAGNKNAGKYPGINRLILAEDDGDDVDFFSRSLSTLSAEINLSVVFDGHELITSLKRDEPLPDLVFLDVNMPRKNGYECLTEIRRDKRLSHLPVAIISTSGDPHTIDAFYKLGASAFIAKPKDLRSWAVLIDKALSRTWSSERVSRDRFEIEP